MGPRVDAMGKQLPSKKPSAIFPSSKKGKTRFLLKTNLTKKPVGQSSQTRLWQKVPYVRNGFVLRMDRVKWKRNLKDLLNADEDRMVNILTEDGFLPDLEQDETPLLQRQCGVTTAEARWASTAVSLPKQELPQVYLATSSSSRLHFRQRVRRTFSCCTRLCSTPAAGRRPAFQHPHSTGYEPQSCRAH